MSKRRGPAVDWGISVGFYPKHDLVLTTTFWMPKSRKGAIANRDKVPFGHLTARQAELVTEEIPST